MPTISLLYNIAMASDRLYRNSALLGASMITLAYSRGQPKPACFAAGIPIRDMTGMLPKARITVHGS